MRVTKEVKQETRQRILHASQTLFRTKGFDATTTRDIAAEAGIATGTLFNYFPNKESLVLSFVDGALATARKSFRKHNAASDSIDEDLFAFVAAGLRKLRPFRKYIRPLLDACLNPLADDEVAQHIRAKQLQVVDEILNRHGMKTPISAIALNMFWTLYMGVLAFWSNDPSPHQEDTLALIDESTRMFAAWIDLQQDPDHGS